MGGASSSDVPARVFGSTGAGYGTGPSPTPLARVRDAVPLIETMPGGGYVNGVVPLIRSFGSAVGASDSTVPTPS
eukprot:4728044-Heterocapsa_arctica.AAC.1